MDFDRLKLLEQKVEVMQKEISEVLGEMQKTIQGLARMTQIGLRVATERLDKLEQPTSTVRTDEGGKEL